MKETIVENNNWQSENYWNIKITPHGSIWKLGLKEVWHYKDLLLLLVRRDFVSFYKQTVLGPLWFLLQPLFTTVIFSYIFGKLAHVPTDGIPTPIFYMAGIIWWNYFSECLNKTSTVFKDNASVFGKVYFPRLIMPLSIILSNLVKFGIQFFMFIVLLGYYYATKQIVGMNYYCLLLPALILLMALLGLGLGMLVSALTTKYRDLVFLITFGVQLLMYATTVVYPLSAAPKGYKQLVALNPMTPILEAFRYGFLGAGSFSWLSLSISASMILIIVMLGTFIFNKVERNFIDTV